MNPVIKLAVPLFAALLVGEQRAVASVEAAHEGVFVSGLLGYAQLNEEGHAPPICCNEREDWQAPGARLGLRLGYMFLNQFFVQADLAMARHSVARPDLTLVIPEVAASAGLRWIGPLMVDFSLGAGARQVTGRDPDLDENFSAMLVDVRLNIGLLRRFSDRLAFGGELTFSKVLIEQNVLIASLVASWY